MFKLLLFLYFVPLLYCWSESEFVNGNLSSKAFTWDEFLTPRNGKYNISDECIEAGDIYLDELSNWF